jgi:hypothetical protein
MAVENEEIEVQRAPLIFIVPALGFVVTARTKQFQLVQSTNEQISYPGAQRLRADLTREVKPEQGLRALTVSPLTGRIELLVFLFAGLAAIVARVSCISELFHRLANAVL